MDELIKDLYLASEKLLTLYYKEEKKEKKELIKKKYQELNKKIHRLTIEKFIVNKDLYNESVEKIKIINQKMESEINKLQNNESLSTAIINFISSIEKIILSII